MHTVKQLEAITPLWTGGIRTGAMTTGNNVLVVC